ncbi:tetratricopeptide repeat protein [Aquiflexum gelatinilyticum]|jgi:tetratricopeptide (TPR) repeat protein|uniref:tetratricopeptide repeat protein n=1 Tax=Aquiflexum gelatinilyticum TaxID=2961943 RepID=UPI0021689E38|nr:tetratricopeptide repeat protein [Aquiflexum gelatinilyticum]MCS4434517.1 tetratricopeptide repeat protein [Aquiflexum gelatinilyticum]
MNKIMMTVTLMLAMVISVFAQDKPVDSETNQKRNEIDRKIYQLALRYNDLAVARMKLFELIERNPTNITYPETLISLYFEAGQYTSAAVSALDVLEMNDKSLIALEVAANSLEQLGALDKALPNFERHYLLTNNLFSLYKTAYMQYSLNRQDEALNSINMLVKAPKSSEEKVGFPKNDNTTQEVSLKAAALNLKGMVYMYQKNKAEAITALNQALEIQADFELAIENLKEANKM